MIVDVLQRQSPFALQNHTGPRRVKPGPKFTSASVHRVKEDAVGLDGGDQFGERLYIVRSLPARAGVPRVVVNENFHVEPVASAAELAQAVQPARHVAVEIELVAIVHANPRVGMPQHKAVVATELAPAVVEERIRRVGARERIVERLVAHHQKTAGKRRGRPGELRLPVEHISVVQPPLRLLAPALQLLPECGPVCRIGGRGDDILVRFELPGC